MSPTRAEFDALRAFATSDSELCSQQVANATSHPHEVVEQTLDTLTRNGLIARGRITKTTHPFECYVYKAHYTSVYAEGPTDEWCLGSDESDRIVLTSVGEHDSWVMAGHVYFDQAFSRRFAPLLDNITQALGCSRADIHDFLPVSQGLIDLSFHFLVKGQEYVYRHPGIGTEKFVNRDAEGAGVGEWEGIYESHAVDQVDRVLAWHEDGE